MTPERCAGRVEAVCVSPSSAATPGKEVKASILLIPRFGVEGDRHAGRDEERAVALLRAETLDELAHDGWLVPPGALSENLLIRGLELQDLYPGARLQIGDALLELTRARSPCVQLEDVSVGLLRATVGEGVGWFVRVLEGGAVRSRMEVELV